LAPAWEDPRWQENVHKLIADTEQWLWSPEAERLRDWLTFRGVDASTACRLRLGFMPVDSFTEAAERRGKRDFRPRELFVPRGLTIPWPLPGSSFWGPTGGADPRPRWSGMNIRRLADDPFDDLPEGMEKYRCIKGSSRGYLYPWTIGRDQLVRPALIVEGELDAALGWQEVGDLVHVVTAGSASVRRLRPETLAALARCPWWLLALDHDRAGIKAVRQWRALAPHKARRVLLPSGKDLTEFVRQGGDLRGWVRAELDRLGWRVPDPTPADDASWQQPLVELPRDASWRRWLVELPHDVRTAWRRRVYDELFDKEWICTTEQVEDCERVELERLLTTPPSGP
jgi:hypothetical protein